MVPSQSPVWFTLDSLACVYLADSGRHRFADLRFEIVPRPLALGMLDQIGRTGRPAAIVSSGDPGFTRHVASLLPVSTGAISVTTVGQLKESGYSGPPPIVVGAIDVPRSSAVSKAAFSASTAGQILAVTGAPRSQYVCIGATGATASSDMDGQARRMVMGRTRLSALTGLALSEMSVRDSKGTNAHVDTEISLGR